MGQPGGWGYDPGGCQEQLVEDLDLLYKQGIRAVVSLTERPLKRSLLEEKGVAYLHLPVADMEPPTPENVVAFSEFVDQNEKENRSVVVHCGAGRGRTGTLLVIYLIQRGCDAREALAQVRMKRPGSVETAEQEAVLFEYAENLKKDEVEERS